MSYDRYVIAGLEYMTFIRDCELADEESASHALSHLDTIFIACNVEDTVNISKDQAAANALNQDRALMRFEYIEALVRIAVAKYVKPGHMSDLSDALNALLETDLRGRVPREALHDPDAFRRSRLYTRATHEVILAHAKPLHTLFEHYAAGKDEYGTSGRAVLMDLDEWEALLGEASILDDDFSKRQAALCFVWSQPCCTAAALAGAPAPAPSKASNDGSDEDED